VHPILINLSTAFFDLESKKAVDKLIKIGCTLQETRNLLTNEIDWRIKCGSRIIVSTPREDIGASMLIAEDLSPNINVPVEVVPMEELEKVLCNSNNGTIVTSRYFLQPLEKLAKQYRVRAIAVDLSDFQKELKIIKELKPGSCVGIVSISPGLLRADIDYAEAEALTAYGIIGIKVWVYQGEVFAKEFSQETNKVILKESKD
jgi:GntR family transcriptional regulator